jgi:hypothetical protein
MGEKVRATLQQELPEYDFSRLEIYPSNSPQILAPLRADKITVIGCGILGKVEKYKMEKQNGKKRRVYYQTHSCAEYLNWIYFSDTQFDQHVFEQVLRSTVARCPDKPAKPTTKQKLKKKPTSPGGRGSIGSLKGRCASALVRFWSELEVPENDTVGKYIIVTLRILKYEGLSSDEAVAWIEDRLQALEYTDFSDRLTDNFEELQRVMAFAVDAVWRNNGYQRDSAMSDVKLKATVEAWSNRGFYLHDPATWENHKQAELKLVWTAPLLALVPELAALAHTSDDLAKVFMEKVLAFVEAHNELAESMVGNLLEEAGIKGRSRQKQHDVRKFLVEKGLLVKQKNYFKDPNSNYRHGNFYICGSGVRFEQEAVSHTTHTVSICYLSLEETSIESDSEDWLDLVMESRRLTCDSRYWERLRQLNRQVLTAA